VLFELARVVWKKPISRKSCLGVEERGRGEEVMMGSGK